MNVKIIGAGLAGCEAANYLANHGVKVDLYEMRPKKMTPAHKTAKFGELVCSNSLRADGLENAVGILKAEMEQFDSLIIREARAHKVEAGGALAVDREGFSQAITDAILSNPNITLHYEEVDEIDPNVPTIIATGPLTDNTLANNIMKMFDATNFHFYDAAAPIVYADSLNYDIVYLKSRYDKGEASYLNCPMTKEQFDVFYDALIHAEGVVPHDFEDIPGDTKKTNNVNDEVKVFEGCMPVEIMAKRGPQTLLFGPLKPVGLRRPDGTSPYAVVQLRQDDAAKTMYNLVGFQTHLKYPEQKRVFSLIPGLENARFAKYGVMHRNSFINAPLILNETYQTKKYPNIFFAGQLSGVEGYVESAASGIVAGINMFRYLNGKELYKFSRKTVIGSQAYYITHASSVGFEPMNANFGIMEDLDFKHNKKDRKHLYGQRALEEIKKAYEEIENDGR
jgi:methylenetetrahydrofolate--tRNA-(uracil-5-)-methyltransferase